MFWMLLASTAWSGDVWISARGVAESWRDPAIGSVYRTGALESGAAVVVNLFSKLNLDTEVGYRKMYASQERDDLVFEMLPVSTVAEWTFTSDEGVLDGFAGLGPSFAGYRERHPPDAGGLSVTRGAKMSVETRVGLRFDTGLVQPRMSPSPSPFKGLDLEIYGARRFQFGKKGFDLGAWRGGLGLALRL